MLLIGVAEAGAVAEADTSPSVQASVEPGARSGGIPQMPGNRSSLRSQGHPTRYEPWGLASLTGLALTLALTVLLSPRNAHADSATVPKPRSASNLDGLHIWLGPIGAATHIEGEWDSAWGGTVAAIRIRERARLGAVGAWLGGAHYALRNGGRIWIDGVAGTRWLGGKMLGIAAGPVVELGDLHHPRVGGQATIWCFAGVVPYARLGVLEASGSFVEVGISLSVPALRF